MSNPIKLSGIDTSGKMLKIPKEESYPYSIKPSFDANAQESDITIFLRDRLKLRIFKIGSDNEEPVGGPVSPVKAGSEIVFLMNTLQLEETGLYIGRIAQSTRAITEANFGNAEVITEFSFRVIGANVLSSQVSAFSAIEQLPQNLKDVQVGLKRPKREDTPDQKLWESIKLSSRAISFNAYLEFMDEICGTGKIIQEGEKKGLLKNLAAKRYLPFTDTDSYRSIKVLTEFFLLVNCPIDLDQLAPYSVPVEYPESENGTIQNQTLYTLPFYKVIRDRLPELNIKIKSIGEILDIFAKEQETPARGEVSKLNNCYGILKENLSRPCFLELIWSYWHEESMLVQALNAISLRFQNVRANGRAKDPLANMEIAPLRPLNNLLWGYIQDEQHRLSVKRRAYEYNHHYGISVVGKAVPNVEGADPRTRFLEAFHLLLNRSSQFFKDDDDLTKVADGYSLLNGLREVHFILSEGMHNQYGDLPFTARVEMLTQQWLLARPELREFLPSRTMVAYPEGWMGPLATMNNLQGWTDNSPAHFNTLAIYGEMLLLSIRFGNWNDLSLTSDNAANWARAFRSEIQGYVHAYQAVTGVDLTITNPQTGKIDAQQPAVHLLRRAKVGANGNGQVKTGTLAQ